MVKRARKAKPTHRANQQADDFNKMLTQPHKVGSTLRIRLPNCYVPDGASTVLSEQDPNGTPHNQPGAKLDANKAPVVRGVDHYFPRALEQVALVSAFGANKYTWGGWESVPNGVVRYGDALGRHLLREKIDGPLDPETGLMHAAQVAWNALARLELMLRNKSGEDVCG